MEFIGLKDIEGFYFTIESSIWKNVVDLLSLIDETVIEFNSEKMKVSTLENDHVVQVILELGKENFEAYWILNDKTLFPFDFDLHHRALMNVQPNEYLNLSVENEKIRFRYKDKENPDEYWKYISSQEGILDNRVKEKEQAWVADVSIDIEKFLLILKRAYDASEYVQVYVSNNGIEIKGFDEKYDEVYIEKISTFWNIAKGVESCRSEFSAYRLWDIQECLKKAYKRYIDENEDYEPVIVQLRLGTDIPLSIKCNFSGIEIQYIVAPRVMRND